MVFHKLEYLALGYNRFDVLCIGGAGGRAGHVTETIPDSATHHQVPPFDYDLFFNSFVHWFGGGGGGGGIHRVKGRLALLPTNVPVVVGDAGANGADTEVTAPFHDYHSGGTGEIPVDIPSGADGEASSFGGTICRASGGKGGVGINGGAGGIGNAGLAGGGADPGDDGVWNGVIGSGGGGGQGSKSWALPDSQFGRGDSTPSGDGAVSSLDPVTSGPGEDSAAFGYDWTRIDHGTDGYNSLSAQHLAVPHAFGAAGGGAKPYVINGETVQYGSKAGGRPGSGIVVIRLTYVIT